ncbi:unnamed protein product [Lymnaea stagnalis]|uniref:Uncharacterized protein n=1 Tax=Lymnaea stagnalis TaxID=6523 RepID=A0AAV2GZT4_LYMST
MMVEQSRRRSLRLAKHRHEVGRRGTPLEVSPDTESSDSKLGLDACIDLSDELICRRELRQPQNSADQLTTATEYLHVYSPPTDKTTPTEYLHVHSPPTDQKRHQGEVE